MKTAAILLGVCLSVATATSADVDVVAPTVNATAEAATNATANATSTGGATINSSPIFVRECYPPGLYGWYRLNKGDGPHNCHIPPLTQEWGMLASYRDGGVQNVHWKYTDNENDPECMQNWNYHAADGRTLKTFVAGRTTTYGLNRRWCGLPVYNDGGVQGFQWDYCSCRTQIYYPITRPPKRD